MKGGCCSLPSLPSTRLLCSLLPVMKTLVLVVALAAVVFSFPRPQEGAADEYHEGPWPVIPYEYAFEISDEETLTYYSRTETKLPNGDVLGSWAVLLPDDTIQTVVYNVTKGYGLRQHISYTPADDFDFYR